MYDLTEHDLEDLALVERRDVRLPDGAVVEIIAKRHHWLAVEECYDYGWSQDEIVALSLGESQETGRNLSECFCYVLGYIKADARHVLGPSDGSEPTLPLLPNAYEPRQVVLDD